MIATPTKKERQNTEKILVKELLLKMMGVFTIPDNTIASSRGITDGKT